MSQRTSVVTASALALGSGLLATKAFVLVDLPSSVSVRPQASALRGASAGVVADAGSSTSKLALPAMALVGAIAAAASHTRSGRGRITLAAEPISVAAAAAVAAKAAAVAKTAAAAKGAVQTVSAVAGSAATGSMAKGAGERKIDYELAGRPLNIKDQGTSEYEAIKAERAKVNEQEWEVRTSRNPDGNFGDAKSVYKGKANMYDPLSSLSDVWLNEAGEEFNPAFQMGVTAPLGFFDPAGFCKKGDEKGFRNFRTAEIKHGRVAMMAALGAVVQHFVKFPGFQDVPSGLGAVSAPPGSYGFIALFAITGALELGVWTESDDKAPGDFGDPLGLNQYNEDTRNRELNNGRFAMFSALGVIAAELFTGKDAVEQLGF